VEARARTTVLAVAAVAAAVAAGLALADERSGPPAAGADRPRDGGAAEDAPASPEGQALTLAATGIGLGNLEPCDCVEGMLGGFPRRIAELTRLRGAGPVAFVDLGDLTGSGHHPRLLELKARASLDLLAQAGAAAVAVGERDLRLGADALRAAADAAGVALLAANVRQGQARPFAAWTAAEHGGRRLVFVGALDPALGDPSGALELDPPGPAVAAALAAAGPADVRVVLFHGEAEAARRALATLDPPPDVVVWGHGARQPPPLARLGAAVAVEVVRDARYLSVLTLGTPPTSTHRPLDGHVPDDPRARRRVDRYYEEAASLPEPPRRQTPGGAFVGSEACGDCHEEAWEAFARSPHHQAQRRILTARPQRARLPECTRCHVTGFGYAGGFVDLETTPDLAEVGCEACHGVGGNHVAAGGERGFGLRPGFPEAWRPLCVGCHDPSNSPEFELGPALERIRHWGPRDAGE